ncbi:hut operon transcriptional regulator HutP [Priestia megaterium]|jgi:hut operon positive regulatory protein|uniref:hut operon transcriptional regulator HutP n=1 Tax=Priestia TaxID=2800373 RepID=UPI00094CAFEF|nr:MULTISPECIES: hut operon transcriptional regulator HutP [Priestia]MBY0089294.1 hut operon transcriptional regulator HutP [Priestia aryabhattai]MBY0103944.1 hut operon transcriptional regulator HutP [Priestia aryabhattai]MCM3308123.1 hut operon transcriptional regulator HutP [Priestia megaterium]MED4141435.1 hut operon transcriptional regulator HutP [Priestia megaterium]OLO38184.1 transcriptional regulator [Priestia megaterium]
MSNQVKQKNNFSMGKLTSLLVLLHNTELVKEVEQELDSRGYNYTVGKVGAMELSKVVAAVETSAKNNHIINANSYREVHALYHAILEAIQGVSRGILQLGDILRTVGLTFSIVRGNIDSSGYGGEWISVCVYGTIGAPKKGFEHDALGFGFNHI